MSAKILSDLQTGDSTYARRLVLRDGNSTYVLFGRKRPWWASRRGPSWLWYLEDGHLAPIAVTAKIAAVEGREERAVKLAEIAKKMEKA